MKKILLVVCIFSTLISYSQSDASDKVVKLRSSTCRLRLKSVSDKWMEKDFKQEHLIVIDYNKMKLNVYDSKLIRDLDLLSCIDKSETDSFIDFTYSCVDEVNKKCYATITLDKKEKSTMFVKIDYGEKQEYYFF